MISQTTEVVFLELESQLGMEEQPLKLQVGERTFTLTLDTLRNAGEESHLYKQVTLEMVNVRDGDPVFIDRDGDLFHHILSFLRSGSYHLGVKDGALLLNLQAEAVFYGVYEMSKVLEDHLLSNPATNVLHIEREDDLARPCSMPFIPSPTHSRLGQYDINNRLGTFEVIPVRPLMSPSGDRSPFAEDGERTSKSMWDCMNDNPDPPPCAPPSIIRQLGEQKVLCAEDF